MTKLYLDTEYNGFGGSLISMALVADSGEEFYEVVDREIDPNVLGFAKLVHWFHPWVQEHVIPVLNRNPVSLHRFKATLYVFLGQFDNPEIICDWHEDLIHFCECLKGRDYASSLNYPFRASVLVDTKPISKIPHNALEDARALRWWCTPTSAGFPS